MNAGGDKGEKTILLVEDDKGNRTIFAEILTDLGYMVIDKPDVTSALEVVRNEMPIDLVITDYRLPDSDGFTLVEAMRKVRPGVQIIMMTAYGNAENYIRSMSLGVFEYLNKPVKKKEFERIVSFALSKSASA
ncbi:MAG TPA: response regulator [Nitrospirota bacterium]